MRVTNLFCLLLLLTVSACVVIEPIPIYRIEPLGETPKWLNGQAFVVREDSTQMVVIGFYRSQGNRLLFDVEAVNLSDAEILVDPQSFHIKTQSNPSTIIAAINPETTLLRLDMQQSQETARYKTQETNSAMLGLADVLVGIADNAAAVGKKESLEEAEARRIRNEERDARFLRNEIRSQNREYEYRAQNQAIRDSRIAIENEFLRKTTLTKGYRATGKVAFPAFGGSGAFQMILPVGNRDYAIWFYQKEFSASEYEAIEPTELDAP